MTGFTSAKVIVGKVVHPHGVQGKIKISTDSDNPERFQKQQKLLINEKLFSIRDSTVIDNHHFLLSLDDITTHEKASQLQGLLIYAPTGTSPKLPEDFYYHYQLINHPNQYFEIIHF